MLMCAITLAVIYTWLDSNPQDVYMLLLAALPVLDVMITAPKSILPYMVMVTSVEMMKTKGAHEIAETLTEMKTEKTLKMLKMLNTLQAQAKRVQKMQKMEKGTGRACPSPSPRSSTRSRRRSCARPSSSSTRTAAARSTSRSSRP